MRLHGGKRVIQSATVKCTNFVERARGKHAVETRRDTAVELLTVHVEKDAHRLMRFDRRFHAIAVPFAERPTGCERNFKGAGDSSAVTGHESPCRLGITRSELGMELRRTFLLQATAQRQPQLHWNRRNFGKPMGQCPEIETGPTHHDGQASRLLDGARGGARIDAPAAGRIVFRRIDMTIKEMGSSGFILRRRARRNDPQVAVDLHGVGIDDSSAESLRNLERESRLAARGWPCDKHRPH